MESKKTDFAKLAIAYMQTFREQCEKSKYDWSTQYYEHTFHKIEHAVENGRQALEELQEKKKSNQSGVALQQAVAELKKNNKMYALFFNRLNTDAAAALEKFPAEEKAIEDQKHELINIAGGVYSSMETVLHDMEQHIPKRRKPMAASL